MVDLTFRSIGAWGAGKGANLTAPEVDNNFWSLAQAIFDLQNDPATPNGIASITVSGTQMTITLHDGTVMGPFELPLLTFRWRGEWQPFTAYAELDVFTVTNTGIYLVQIAHTTGSAFDPNLLIPPTTGLPAYLMLFGSTDASLSALPDVALTALADEDFLTWDTTTAKWVNVGLGGMAYQEPNAVAITSGVITGLPVPINPTDAATKAYVDAGPAGSTAADGTMMSNIAGSVAAAIPNTLSAYLDHVLATTVRGTLLYRGGSGWLALLPGTSGLYLRTAGSGADPAWAAAPGGVTSINAGTGISTGGAAITSTGTVSLATVADSAMLANAAGASAAPVPLTLTQFLDHALTSSRGTLLVRNVTGWNALAPGTSGTFLKSLGSGADLAWDSPLGAGTVTSVAAGTGLTAVPGPITAAGTISFAQIANGTLLANISGSTAAPVPSTLSLIFDSILSSTQGAVLYRGASAWSALGPGTSGQFLSTGGAAANPSWASASGAAPIAASNIPANLTGATALALGHTLTDILDYIISSSRGTLLYRGASGWAGLAPGTSGQVLSTGGTTGDPSWIAAGGGSSGGLLARRVFTAGATYTPTTGTTWVIVTVVSGGGAGGGVAATSATQQAEGSGGGSAGATQKTITSGFSGATITIGAGGVAASGAVGGNGGASSFGTYTAGGGSGGALGTATANAGVLGGAGGTATGGDISIPGSRGSVSSGILNGGGAISGRGGNTPLGYGSGGEEQMGSAAGVAGTGYGSGGSGAINGASQSARAGGNGAPGLVVVEEYAGTPTAPVTHVVYLTAASSSPWTVPADWNNANNKIETIGGGAGGGHASGGEAGAGGGGAYSSVTNQTLSGTVLFTVGVGGAGGTVASGVAGGDTWFGASTLAASLVGAKGGATNTGPTGGAGGASGAGIGAVKYAGGNGGTIGGSTNGSCGGGGAAGPGGAGRNGGTNGTTGSGGGGGGAGGGSSTAGSNAASGTLGGAGGLAQDGTAGGTAGASTDGGDGSHGSGGGGGGAGGGTPGRGGIGGSGVEWDGTHGAGGGGGGSSADGAARHGGAGGLYGGGGGSGGYPYGNGGAGANGLIVITYTS